MAGGEGREPQREVKGWGKAPGTNSKALTVTGDSAKIKQQPILAECTEKIQNTMMRGVILIGLDGDIGDLPIESGDDISDAAVLCTGPRWSITCCNAANKRPVPLLWGYAGGTEARVKAENCASMIGVAVVSLGAPAGVGPSETLDPLRECLRCQRPLVDAARRPKKEPALGGALLCQSSLRQESACSVPVPPGRRPRLVGPALSLTTATLEFE